MSGLAELGVRQGNLRVGFQRSGDRYAHQLLIDDPGLGKSRLLAESLEGIDQDWPPSPPLQQLSVEDLGNGPVGLLVGMAGRSHWSLSVEETASGFDFDAACRVREPWQTLGSAYRLHDFANVDAVQQDQQQISLSGQHALLTWRIEVDPKYARSQFDWDPQSGVLKISLLPDPSLSDTVRWRYHVQAQAIHA